MPAVRGPFWHSPMTPPAAGCGSRTSTPSRSRPPTRTATAARRLEVTLDLLGCLACPPTGYLLDPAYAGMLGPDEKALAEALHALDEQVSDGARETWAWQLVASVLRRLGADA